MAKSLPEHSVLNLEEALDLRSLREHRGLSLNDIFQATKISVKNLEAMERGDFHGLPPPVYTKAYFKSYARFLGLDERLIIGRYEHNLALSAQVVEEEIEEVPEKDGFFSKKIIVNVATILVLVIVGGFTYFHFQVPDVALEKPLTLSSKEKTGTETKNLDGSDQPAILSSVDAEGDVEGKSAQTRLVPAATASTRGAVNTEETTDAVIKPSVVKPTLIIIAREKTWLRITEDQKDVYEMLMRPGERIERSALQYDIDIGNAGGVSVQFQENSMITLGKSGEVVHLRLP